MPFDYVMGVGKTPQITQDVSTINPYSITQDEIAGYSVITRVLGANTIENGSPLNIINPYFDYVTNTAYSMGNASPGLNTTGTLNIDIGKELILRSFQMYCTLSDTVPPLNITVTVSSSRDGIRFIQLESVTPSNSSYTFTYTDVLARYFKFEVTLNSGGTGSCAITFNQLSIKIDSKQLSYKL